MDIQKIIGDVVAKLTSDPELVKSFLSNPVETLEKTFGVDLPDDQINQVIEGIKNNIDLSKIDLSKIDLSNIDLGDTAGLLGKLKGLFGK